MLTRQLKDLIVPDTIQDVIAARIDRLPEAPKRALQTASVIGREFSRRLLDSIVGAGARTEILLRDLTALKARVHDPRLRDSLERAPFIRRVYDLTVTG